jgi:long-chain acyl-CoA synthetase
MGLMGDSTGRVMVESGTLRSVIGGLSAFGGRPAVVAFGEGGMETWSYGELGGRVGRLAVGLRGVGVGRGDHVAILCGNGFGWISACLAVISAGGVVVPLDVQLGDEVLGRVLRDSGAGHVFTTADEVGRLEKLGEDVGLGSILLDVGEEDGRSWRNLPAGGDLPEFEPGDGAALFYTSGTTGAAKGVPLSHANLAFQIDSLLGADFVLEDDRVLLPLPLHHVYAFVMGMLTPLAAGLPIVLPQSLTGPQLVRALREGEATLIVGVPRLYGVLYSGIEERVASGGRLAATLFETGVDLSARLRRLTGLDVGKVAWRPLRRRFGPRLRVLASGGAALDAELASKLEGIGWRVAIGYGLTETAPLLALNPPDGKELGSVGRPVPGVEITIDTSAVPEDAARTGAPRGEGEILARGPNVFSGYRNRPEETGKVFDESGRFRTGDLGYFDDDGYLYVTGRVSTLIVTPGGKNVQPEAVEAAYLENPAIREIGVLQKGGRLVALIVPETDGVPKGRDTSIAMREAVEEGSRRLPSYQRILDYATSREPLEYTRLGKLRRHVLEERFDLARSGKAKDLIAGPVAVSQMLEEDRALLEDPAVRGVWELLVERFPDRRLAPDTSPQLDLDIDSLGWVNLTLEIGEKTGVELREEAIGRIGTVRDLLREVASGAGSTTQRVSSLERPEGFHDDRQRRWLKPLGPVASVAAAGMFALGRATMMGLFRLRVEGLENLPEEGQFIIAPNHVSYLDSFVLAAALPRDVLRRTYWAGWTGAAFGNPLTRLISRLAQVVPVDPDRAGLSSLAFGAAVLRRGQNLVWFAEGERSRTGSVQQFKPGVGMLLEHYPVPVVPVFIRGTYEAMPRGRFLRRLEKVTVSFGAPFEIRDPEVTIWSREQIVDAVRERVVRLGERR